MGKQRGFTLIELAVVIVIIGLLVTIGTVTMRGMQAAARDKEREADVAAIAMYLESIYPKEIKDTSGNTIKPAGWYPYLPNYSSGGDNLPLTNTTFAAMMAGAEAGSLKPPGATGKFVSPDVFNTDNYFMPCYDYNSCYIQNEPTTAALGTDRYMYRPLGNYLSGEYVCTDDILTLGMKGCRSFTLYYVLEGSPTVLRKIESKRR